MRRFAGSCRFVFNKALALQKERHEQGHKKLGYAGLCKLLTGWRNSLETAWLADAPVHPLQQSLKDLERARSESTRLNSSHDQISYAVFCLKKKNEGCANSPHNLSSLPSWHWPTVTSPI